MKRILSFLISIFMFISGLFQGGADYKVKYTDKTVPLIGLEAVSDKERFIVNLDGDHWNSWLNSLCRKGNVTEEALNEYVEWYANTDITDLFFNTFCQTSNTPSDILSFRGNQYLQTEQEGKPVDNSFWQCCHDIYYKYKIDLFKIWFDKCREKGMNPWMSFRMNDCHEPDAETSFLRGDLFYTARKNGWMIGEEYGYYRNCFNYAVPEIRQLMLDYIKEQLLRYDVYGIELDWLREIFCFDYKHADNNEICSIMNDFMRKVNSVVSEAEKKWKHDIKISARLTRDIEQSKVYGFDVKTWAKENLVDSITVTPRWATCDSAMPINNWKTELPGVEIYAGLETLLNVSNDLSHASHEVVNGYMAQYITAGADGIYLYNYYKSSPVNKRSDTVFNSFSSVDEVINSSRRHIVTWQDMVPDGYEPYHPLDTDILYKKPFNLNVETGFIPEGSKVKIKLGFNRKMNKKQIEVSANGIECNYAGGTVIKGDNGGGDETEKAYSEGEVYFYEFLCPQNRFPGNIVSVTAQSNRVLPVTVKYCEIDINQDKLTD